MSGAEAHDLALVVFGALLAAALPLLLAAALRAWKDHALIQDLVLGDPERGIRPIRDYIEERTQPIQEDANGGTSLPDLHTKVDEFAKVLELHIETSLATHEAMWAAIQEDKEHPP